MSIDYTNIQVGDEFTFLGMSAVLLEITQDHVLIEVGNEGRTYEVQRVYPRPSADDPSRSGR